jgi:hypothetical protein
MQLPPCGLYRTRGPIGSIPEGRLVYFHNHGDPGPGLYLPASWKGNRVQLAEKGTQLPSPEDVQLLEPLPAEGFYRVVEAFDCCEKRCRRFEPETLVQLGYDGQGNGILFVPELIDGMLAVPERGNRIEQQHFARLKQLKVAANQRRPEDAH